MGDRVNPTAAQPQPVYAAGQLFYTGHAELVYRLDTTKPTPTLYDADAVAWHGTPGAFPSNLGPVTPSGQSVTGREVPGFVFDEGILPLFTDVTADGTVFTSGLGASGNNIIPGSDKTQVAAFDPDDLVFETGQITNPALVRFAAHTTPGARASGNICARPACLTPTAVTGFSRATSSMVFPR